MRVQHLQNYEQSKITRPNNIIIMFIVDEFKNTTWYALIKSCISVLTRMVFKFYETVPPENHSCVLHKHSNRFVCATSHFQFQHLNLQQF